MGGFVTDVRHLHDGMTRVTIIAPGIIALARHNHFFNISSNSINDRSKADILGKALVIVQVSWLLVNCIGRKILGYPLALLEIHTTVHVICALLMYSFWFKVCTFLIWSHCPEIDQGLTEAPRYQRPDPA